MRTGDGPDEKITHGRCADAHGFSPHAAARDGTTHIVMRLQEFMRSLVVPVPRPRLHLIRFHGVLAPHAKLRAAGARIRARAWPSGADELGLAARARQTAWVVSGRWPEAIGMENGESSTSTV